MSTACISKLIGAGARVNEADRQGRTPLHEAAERGRSDVVAILQTHGANVEAVEMVKHTHTGVHSGMIVNLCSSSRSTKVVRSWFCQYIYIESSAERILLVGF